MSRGYKIAIVGATGAVGEEMRRIVEQRNFPVADLRLLASSRSVGKQLDFKGEKIKVEELTPAHLDGTEIILSSPGATVSKQYVPEAIKRGCVVVDNTSAFRMEPDVPLVVPEVNPHAIKRHKGVIANPNCSTIQMVVVLKPLHDAAKIKRVVVSTYQAVSGTGMKAIIELREQTKALMNGGKYPPKVYPHQIAFNVLPHIDVFLENGYTKEEIKMVNETKKIMEDDSIKVSATTVRVPVYRGHSESVNLEFAAEITPEQARKILAKAPGVTVVDDPSKALYPLAINCDGRDDTFVGRIRRDDTIPHGLNMWIVSDNLRKGAALNAVQIAEKLIGS
ncbi:MAG: aspartate-semialdehyde dehydrogenase [Candidatus Abyssobacteria bacterium SURF_5]|uniref:Aspartate-semialdehyde dehydrogenase n=1 Tax=Abyssobacteria bacterium (strain SURF_5) TaxID=2093360 RepID=A0A3A4P2D3_ABYX5|nr:MAG: aspartate-semialdehyde dehydrogenase [Candidatus Abyssubacteria bacterium SURF_5]